MSSCQPQRRHRWHRAILKVQRPKAATRRRGDVSVITVRRRDRGADSLRRRTGGVEATLSVSPGFSWLIGRWFVKESNISWTSTGFFVLQTQTSATLYQKWPALLLQHLQSWNTLKMLPSVRRFKMKDGQYIQLKNKYMNKSIQLNCLHILYLYNKNTNGILNNKNHFCGVSLSWE